MCFVLCPRAVVALAALPCWMALASSAEPQSKPVSPNELQRELKRQRNSQSRGVDQTALVAVVYDIHGDIISDVSVTLHARGDSCAKETAILTMASSSVGTVVFPNVAPGRYRVCAAGPLEGLRYSAPPSDVELARATITAIEIRVSPVIEEHVDVPALQVPTFFHAASTIEAIFSNSMIEQAPLSSGRTLQSLVMLMPGVTVTESTGTLAQFTAVGQRRFSNRLTIDGINADLGLAANALDGYGVGVAGSGALPAYGTSGSTQTLVPFGAIEEVQIRTTNATSEHARTPGAQTAIVTRAGGARHSGSSFLDMRPRGLAARDWFDNAEGAPIRRPDYWNSGVTLGGPIKSQRLRYFGAWEHQYVNRQRNVMAFVPSLSLRESVPENIRPVLDAYPLPNGPEAPDAGPGLAEFSDQADVRSTLWVLSSRLDADLSTRHRLFARFSLGDSSGDALQGAGLPVRKTPALTFTQTESTDTNSVTIGLRSGWSSLMHDLTVNMTTHDGTLFLGSSTYGHAEDLPLSAFVPPGSSPADIVVGLLGVGGSDFLQAGGEFEKSQLQLQMVDNWSLARGRHEFRLGLEYRRATPSTNPPSHLYTYNFGQVENLLVGAPLFVRLDRLLPTRTRIETWAAFVQDRFRVSPRLTLDLGLRYSVRPSPVSLTETEPLLIQFETLPDVQPHPSGARLWNTSWTNLAPRVAASYQLCTVRGRETNVGVGWSLVFDELSSPGAVAFGRGYPFVSSTVVPSASFPVLPNSLIAPPPAPFRETFFGEAYAVPRNLRSPRTHDWRVAVEQALGGSQRLSLSYVGAAGRDLTYWHGYEKVGTNGSQLIHAYSNDARSDYHALLVEYARRAARGLHGRVNYTWSHAMDTDSGETQLPQPPPTAIPPSSNRASADFDRRHVLRIAGSYTLSPSGLPLRVRSLLADWQIDVAATVQSGTPVDVSTPQFLNFGTYFGTYRLRPDVVPDVSVWITDPSSPTGRHVNPEAFHVPDPPRQGTLGRNTLRAATLRQVDAALSRSIRVNGRLVAHLRLNVFNVFNSANFGAPFADPRFTQFGRSYESYADAQGTGTLTHGGLLPLQQLGGPRAIQIGLRFVW